MLSCICGNQQYESVTHPCWSVDSVGQLQRDDTTAVRFGKCTNCSLVRQTASQIQTVDDYIAYYSKYPPTNPEYRAKDWEHDLDLAKKRADAYGISSGSDRKILDIGSGSGAFVDECRQRGQSAYGCEIAKYAYERSSEFVYRQLFETVHFPTDHFDLTTCHDVLEHSLDPVRLLSEMFRVTKQGGTAVIDFPNFYVEVGDHHWKDTEHIWFFKPDQLETLLTGAGFEITSAEHPIESKVVFYCSKPSQERPTILVPPGMGDSFWTIVKLQSFLKREKLGLPDVTIVCNRERRFQGHLRSVPFLEMFPFVHVTGQAVANAPGFSRIWREAYAHAGRTVFKGIMGFGHFISYNGHLGLGAQLEEIDPDLECNWMPPMWVSLEQQAYQRYCVDQYGKYIALFLPCQGTYQWWLKEFPLTQIIEAVRQIIKCTGYKVLLLGERWDAADNSLKRLAANVPEIVNLIGKTDVAQLFGLLKGASAVIGFPSGLVFMAAVFGVRTLAIWNNYYHPDFAWHAVPPKTRTKTYFIENTLGLTPEKLVSDVESLIKFGTVPNQKYAVTGAIGAGWQFFDQPANESLIGKVASVVHTRRGRLQKNRAQAPALKLPQTSEGEVPGPVFTRTPNSEITIACVLKSGGDYNSDYVRRLSNSLSRNVNMPYRLLCLTDANIAGICEAVPFAGNNNGWWSKVELFRKGLFPAGPVWYFDLDTIITGNIDDLLLIDVDFAALRPWNTANQQKKLLASGIMTWNGDYSFLHDEFSSTASRRFSAGDQEYITFVLNKHKKTYQPLQDIVHGIYSYKRNCINALPPDARVICFHGRPRPHEVMFVPWVRENWR